MEAKMEAKMRSDKRKNPQMFEYRILTNEECKKLSSHANILDKNGDIAAVKITSVKTWKRNNDAEIHCKYGLYEYFVIRLSDSTPNTEFVELIDNS